MEEMADPVLGLGREQLVRILPRQLLVAAQVGNLGTRPEHIRRLRVETGGAVDELQRLIRLSRCGAGERVVAEECRVVRPELECGEQRPLGAGQVAELDQVQREHVEEDHLVWLELEPTPRGLGAFRVAVELVEGFAPQRPALRALERLRSVQCLEHAPGLAMSE